MLRSLVRSSLPLGALLLCVACSSDPPPATDAGMLPTGAPPTDASAGARPLAPAAGSGGTGMMDAGQRSPLDAQPLDAAGDAEAMDARMPGADAAADAAPSDASTDSDSGRPPVASIECPAGATYPNPLPANTQATPVRSDFKFLEGPLWIARRGVLLFSEMDFGASGQTGPSSQIWQLTPPSTFAVFVPGAGSNGLALANDGRVLAATHDVQSLTYFDEATGMREMWPLTYRGKSFNSPNDLAVRSDGNVYFSDPDWQLGPRTSQTGLRGFYRVSPGGQVSLIDGTLQNPNGVALSPDEATLYAGSQGSEIHAWSLAPDGTPSMRRVFATPGSADGLGVDCAGNLYVAGGSVQVFSPSGTKLGDITVSGSPSNLAFGGAARKTLYITAGTTLFSIELNVPGRSY